MGMPRVSGLVFCVATTSLLCACGGSDAPPTPSVTASPSSSSNNILAGGVGCENFPAGLVEQVGKDYVLVRNLALAGGKNVATMEKAMGLPQPETFRQFADVFEQLNVSGVEVLPNFDAPAVTAPAIRELADKLQAALAQSENLSDPAWAELTDFSKRMQNRQQSSVNYYLSQLKCK